MYIMSSIVHQNQFAEDIIGSYFVLQCTYITLRPKLIIYLKHIVGPMKNSTF